MGKVETNVPDLPAPSSGPTVAVAFGGGGARGVAHIHIIETLDAMGIRPVAISGSSIGSIMGAAMASGISGQEIRDHTLATIGKPSTAFGRIWKAARPLGVKDAMENGLRLGPVQHRAHSRGISARQCRAPVRGPEDPDQDPGHRLFRPLRGGVREGRIAARHCRLGRNSGSVPAGQYRGPHHGRWRHLQSGALRQVKRAGPTSSSASMSWDFRRERRGRRRQAST